MLAEDPAPSQPPSGRINPPPASFVSIGNGAVIFTVSEQCFVNKKCHFTINFYGIKLTSFFDILSHKSDPFFPNRPPSQLVCVEREWGGDIKGEFGLVWLEKLWFACGTINQCLLTIIWPSRLRSPATLAKPNPLSTRLYRKQRNGDLGGELRFHWMYKLWFFCCTYSPSFSNPPIIIDHPSYNQTNPFVIPNWHFKVEIQQSTYDQNNNEPWV